RSDARPCSSENHRGEFAVQPAVTTIGSAAAPIRPNAARAIELGRRTPARYDWVRKVPRDTPLLELRLGSYRSEWVMPEEACWVESNNARVLGQLWNDDNLATVGFLQCALIDEGLDVNRERALRHVRANDALIDQCLGTARIEYRLQSSALAVHQHAA